MTIKLPKELKGFAYDKVLIADMNTFDVDLLMPSLFFKVISNGYARGTRVHDSTAIAYYMDQLAAHPQVIGFSDPHSRNVLERLMRSTLLHIGKKGVSRSVEQIEGVAATTFLAFKPDFPIERSRVRQVDTLVYQMLRDELGGSDQCRAFFELVFGTGTIVQGPPVPDGKYDGATVLDTSTRLSLAFLDAFEPNTIRLSAERSRIPIIPAASRRMAISLGRYLRAYHGCMPMDALAFHVRAVINIELFNYTVKLFHALPTLIANPSILPAAMHADDNSSPPDVYVDFVDSPTGLSWEMASTCVRRDLSAVDAFVQANLTLRQLDQYVDRLRNNPRFTEIIEGALGGHDGPEYLAALLKIVVTEPILSAIETRAEHDEESIRQENQLFTESPEETIPASNPAFDRIVSNAPTQVDRVVQLLIEGNKKAAKNTVAWYWSVGGREKPHGILVGKKRNRHSWRYAPSNDLLATFVQLAAVDIPEWDEDNPRPQPIKLRDFLDWLERRFGILVDRPPEPFTGADYVAAAQENLRAMLRRLQQMGIFRDLSDGFTVQELIPPYSKSKEHVAP